MMNSRFKGRYTVVVIAICLVVGIIVALHYQNQTSSTTKSKQQFNASAAVVAEVVAAISETSDTTTTTTTATIASTTSAITSATTSQATTTTTGSSTLKTALIPSVSDVMTVHTALADAVSETRPAITSTESATSDTAEVITILDSKQAVVTVSIPAEFAALHFVDIPEGSDWIDVCISEEDAYWLAAVNGFDLDTAPPAGVYKVPTGVALSVPSSWQDENGIRILPAGISIEVYQTPEEIDPVDNPLNAYLVTPPTEIEE